MTCFPHLYDQHFASGIAAKLIGCRFKAARPGQFEHLLLQDGAVQRPSRFRLQGRDHRVLEIRRDIPFDQDLRRANGDRFTFGLAQLFVRIVSLGGYLEWPQRRLFLAGGCVSSFAKLLPLHVITA
jgi:hypothetical protein